ncbi:MAG: hypothetical protein WEA58_01330 [Balneolaceae bacterium]
MKLLQYSITFLFFLTAFFVQGQNAMAQLQVAPSAIYMDENNTTERIVIRNSSTETVEVAIEMLFGYPATDSEGNVYFKHYESIDEDQPSAIEWIRIYPRFFNLNPGERQTVRFAARPPDGLPSGEYWARPAVVAQLPSVVEAVEGENISTQFNLRKRTILSLNYRMGEVNTGISVNSFSAEVEGTEIKLTADLERLGNAAFLGHYNVRLIDAGGTVRKTEKKEIAVYKDQKRSIRFDSTDLDSGTYSAELELFTDERNSEGIIQASTSISTTTFTIP